MSGRDGIEEIKKQMNKAYLLAMVILSVVAIIGIVAVLFYFVKEIEFTRNMVWALTIIIFVAILCALAIIKAGENIVSEFLVSFFKIENAD